MKPARILAIDPSITCTGWAIGTTEKAKSGRKEFPVPKGEDPALRFHQFGQWLEGLILKYKPSKVIYEDVSYRQQFSADAIETGAALRKRIQEVCAVYRIPFQSVMPNSLKLRATGSGKAEKPAMKARAKQLFGPIYDMDGDKGGDEGDALLLLAFGLGMLPEPEPKPKKPRKRGV